MCSSKDDLVRRAQEGLHFRNGRGIEGGEPPSMGKLESRNPIFLLEVEERVEGPVHCITLSLPQS
jgi:hypothetical protein